MKSAAQEIFRLADFLASTTAAAAGGMPARSHARLHFDGRSRRDTHPSAPFAHVTRVRAARTPPQPRAPTHPPDRARWASASRR